MPESTDLEARARAALTEIATLRKDVARQGLEIYRGWRSRIGRSTFAPSALNFAHYLALRRHDLRPLQRKLTALGISSLGRLESRVLVSLDVVMQALAALARAKVPPTTRPPSEAKFFRGEARLAAHAAEIFGAAHKGRAGRIMVTLATEAADDPAIIRGLAEAGADIVRINCAHDSPPVWERMVRNSRDAETHIHRKLPVLMDIGGPRVRTGRVLTPPDRSRLHIGDVVLLARDIVPQFTEVPFQVTCLPPDVLDHIKVGDEASLDDGQLQGPIIGEAHGGFLVRIERGKLAGLKLRPEKGLNFPTADLGLDPLTDKDRADLAFIVKHADLIGHSFVETAEHVAALQAELARQTDDWQRLGVVGKIETPRAVSNLPEIIVQAAGHQPFAVMIARGDLAVEMGFERVAEMQEEIMWLCEAAHVPVIWATQVLEELVKKGLPSRGEMTDAAMAARAECVLLNKGPNVGAAVGVLDRLLRRMGEHQVKKTPTLRALRSWPHRQPAVDEVRATPYSCRHRARYSPRRLPRVGGTSHVNRKIAEFLRTLVGVGLFTFALKTVAFATYYIPSESMVPTLEVGDRLVATKFDYGYGPYSTAFFSLPTGPFANGRLFERLPERGDIVLFQHPTTGETLVKRVIGLPGDTIRVNVGRLVINGEVMPRRAVRTYAYRQFEGPPVAVTEYEETLPGGRVHPIIMQSDAYPQENTGEYRVPPGRFFVMGDNRDNSADSRFASLGYVPVENLIGRSRVILYSLHGCEPEPGLTCAGRRLLTELE